jgi:hypothetical protein
VLNLGEQIGPREDHLLPVGAADQVGQPEQMLGSGRDGQQGGRLSDRRLSDELLSDAAIEVVLARSRCSSITARLTGGWVPCSAL